MVNSDDSNENVPKSYGSRLEAIRIQLRSQLPSDTWRAMEQIKIWLQENPENQDIYNLLLDVAQGNQDLRDDIHNVIEGMIGKGSKAATTAMNAFPVSIENLIAIADKAYYATEYEKAIQLYERVLQLEHNNRHAQVQLAKAKGNRIDNIGAESNTRLPSEAIQWFRQARSYSAAKDIRTAIIFLKAAVEEAQIKGVKFPEAEELLYTLQSLFDEVEHITYEKTLFKYDVFISYSHRDEDWVQNHLLSYLESQNISVCIDFRDFEVGAPNLTEMERAVIQSRKTIIVLTPEYLRSAWAEFENILAQNQDPAAHNRTLLPILLKPCELPLRLRSLNYLDFTRSDRMKFQFDRLVSAIKNIPN